MTECSPTTDSVRRERTQGTGAGFQELILQGTDGDRKNPLTEELYRGYIKNEYGVKYAIDIKNRMPRNNGHLIVTNY